MKNLKFLKTAYFPNFLKNGAKLMDALCSLVSDLQTDRDFTVTKFLDHAGSEDFIWAILKLLGFQNEKIAGNAAYVIGTIADTSSGSERLISLVNKEEEVGNKVLNDLMRLLRFSDDEIVLNGVGALGSLADSESGRQWLCNATQFDELLTKICSLVRHKNVWIGSNSALLLARLTILDAGLSRMLVHANAKDICTNLVLSLGTDAAGRGMNAAFALGRIVDVSGGQELVSVLDEDLHRILVKALSKMSEDRDVGTAKNALYALSCLAGQKLGSSILARNKAIESIAKHLTDMLVNDLADNELRWFCAMTLRSFACQQKTCLELKKLHFVYNNCKAALRMSNLSDDIKEEVIDVFEFLKPLPQMQPPHLELTGPLTIKAEWEEVKLRGPFTARYALYHQNDGAEAKCIYTGPQTSFLLTDMKPYSLQNFQLRLVTDHEEGPLSESVAIRTEEWLPGQVRNLHMVGHTATQIRVAWEEPLDPNGIIRNYVIYIDDNPKSVGRTEELYFILQNLNQTQSQDRVQYTVHIAAVTGRGEGLRQSLQVTTAEAGECRPSKPSITVLGRSELYVTWSAPPNPPGKIIRYELLANNEVVYSGTELYASVTRLQPETEYSFQVVLFSNEGRFQSLISKRYTARDEFVAFNGPRTTSSSKSSRRSAKSRKGSAVAKDSIPAEVQANLVPPATADEAQSMETMDTSIENASSVVASDENMADSQLADSTNAVRTVTPPPPKPFSRSKTTLSSRKGSNRRNVSRRSLPPVHKELSPSQSLPIQSTSTAPPPPPTTAKPTSPGDELINRERSSTTGSKSDKDEYSSGLTNVKQRRNRSLSMINKLISRPKATEPRTSLGALFSGNSSTRGDIRCSVVTLNLPQDTPASFETTTSRWAFNMVHRPEMISATVSPMVESKKTFQEPLRRANTIIQGYPGHKSGDSVFVAPGTPALGQRGLTIYTDSGKEHASPSIVTAMMNTADMANYQTAAQQQSSNRYGPPRMQLLKQRQSHRTHNIAAPVQVNPLQ